MCPMATNCVSILAGTWACAATAANEIARTALRKRFVSDVTRSPCRAITLAYARGSEQRPLALALEEVRDLLAAFFGVVNRNFAGFVQALAGFDYRVARKMVGLLGAFGRFHGYRFCTVIDALHRDLGRFQAVLADVIHLVRR